MDSSKITGVTRIEDDAVLLILDLESVVQELGLYQPASGKLEDGKYHFSGYVLLLDGSEERRVGKEC